MLFYAYATLFVIPALIVAGIAGTMFPDPGKPFGAWPAIWSFGVTYFVCWGLLVGTIIIKEAIKMRQEDKKRSNAF